MSRQDPIQPIDSSKPQFQLCVRTFAPWPSFGGFGVLYFEEDNRSFSTSPDATFRTGGFLVFDLDPGSISEGPVGISSGTRFHDSTDPKVFSDVLAKVSQVKSDEGRIAFRFDTMGANPMVPLSPDIDIKLNFVAFIVGNNLSFAGKLLGDGFPNAEIYIRDNKGNPFSLLTFQTDHGPNAGPITLIGDGTDPMGNFQFGILLDDDHTFIGSVPFGE